MANTPKIIGHYWVQKELGRGGFGVVYQAIDLFRMRKVAVKQLLSEHFYDQAIRGLFIREIRTIKKLKNEAIVPVYDVGEDKGLPYLVMKFMEGGTLSDKIKDHSAISLAEVVAIFNRLAPALNEVHLKNVIHRDLKPKNILLDKEGLTYLADFGIVREIDQPTMTHLRQPMGSVEYMAPEQFYGHASFQSDIYSLGIILFKLLTGISPIKAKNRDNGTWQVAWQMAHSNDPIPSACTLNDELPPGIDEIIQRALAKRPEDRYRNAQEMVLRLNAIYKEWISEQTEKGTTTVRIPEKTAERVIESPTTIWRYITTVGVFILVACLVGIIGTTITTKPIFTLLPPTTNIATAILTPTHTITSPTAFEPPQIIQPEFSVENSISKVEPATIMVNEWADITLIVNGNRDFITQKNITCLWTIYSSESSRIIDTQGQCHLPVELYRPANEVKTILVTTVLKGATILTSTKSTIVIHQN